MHMDSIYLEVLNSWDIYLRDHTYNPSFLQSTVVLMALRNVIFNISMSSVRLESSKKKKKQIRMDGFRFPGKNKATKKIKCLIDRRYQL